MARSVAEELEELIRGISSGRERTIVAIDGRCGKNHAGGGAAAAVGLHGVPHGRLFPAARAADGGAAVNARGQCGL